MPSSNISKRGAQINLVDDKGSVIGTRTIEVEIPYDLIHRQYSEYLLAVAAWWSSKENVREPEWDTMFVTPYNDVAWVTGEMVFMVKEGATDWFDFVIRRGDRTYWVLPNLDSGKVDAEIILL